MRGGCHHDLMRDGKGKGVTKAGDGIKRKAEGKGKGKLLGDSRQQSTKYGLLA